MQITFDPLNPQDVQHVVSILELLDADDAPATLAPDVTGPDTRDAASVFGAAGAAPLALAPSTAAAGLLPIAPVALQGSLPPPMPGVLPLAQTAPLPGVAPLAPAGQTAPASGAQLDSNGLPWDARIHAANKGQNKDGSWRAKKGLNDGAFVKQVETELRQVQALPNGQSLTAAAPPAAQSAATTPPVGTVAPQPLQLLQPAAPLYNMVPANFDEMMPRITAQVTAGAMPQDALLLACQAHGLPGIVALTARPDYVAVIWKYLQSAFPALV